MTYRAGYRRRGSEKTEAGRERAVPGSRTDREERLFFLVGILAVALSLALPLSRAGEEDRTVPREAVAVMSTALDAGEPENPEENESQSVSASGTDSIYDEIGRFFARLLTGG